MFQVIVFIQFVTMIVAVAYASINLLIDVIVYRDSGSENSANRVQNSFKHFKVSFLGVFAIAYWLAKVISNVSKSVRETAREVRELV